MSEVTGSAAETSSTAEASAEGGDNAEIAESNAQGAKTQASKAPEAPKKYVVKIDGKEAEVDEKELIKSYQLAKTSYQRMAEANKARQEAESLLKQVEEDPIKFLQHRNKNVRDAAEKYLYEELKKEQMTPEQRELAEYKAKVAQIEKEKAEAQKQEEDRAFQAEQQRVAQEMDKALTEALSKSNLPKKAFTVGRIAYIMESALNNGIDLPIEDAIEHYKQSYGNDAIEYLSTYEGDELLNALGKDLLNKIRKADIGRIKSTPTQKEARTSSKPQSNSGKQKMTFEQMLEKIKQ